MNILPTQRSERRFGLPGLCCLVCCCSLLVSCSGSNPNDPNPVDQYDHEFNDPARAKARAKRDATYLPNLGAEQDLLERATDAYDRGLYTLAKDTFTRLQEEYPSSYYVPLAELKIADCLFYLNELPSALTAYEEFLRLHPKHEAVPYVHLQIANTYLQQYKGPTHDQAPLNSAIKRYEKLIEEFPDSEYAPFARRKIAAAREDLAAHHAVVAAFYHRQGAREASAARYRTLLQNYPETSAAMEAAEQLPVLFGDNPAQLRSILQRDRRLAAAANARELRPSAPVIAGYGRGKARLRSPAAGYRRVLQRDRQSGLQTEVIAARRKPAPDRPSFAAALECEQQDAFTIFTVRLNAAGEAAEPKIHPGDRAHMLKMTLAPAGSGEELIPAAAELQCEAGSAKIALEPEADELQLQLTYPRGMSIRYFFLDRPYRLIALVEPATRAPKVVYRSSPKNES